MSLSFQIQEFTGPEWIDCVLKNFDTFVIDHAACERKASATGISFVVRYPDREHLTDPMIRLAREELLHFQQVCRILKKRGLQLQPDEKNPYVNGILGMIRRGRDEEFLDRLLTFGIIEARGTERFGAVAKNIQDAELAQFYTKLTESEARHHQQFIKMALHYFPVSVVEKRVREIEEIEFQMIQSLPIRAAVH